MAEQVFCAWNTCIELAWHVPRGTHTYFVDRLLGCGISHVKNDILARYVTFFQSLRKSPCMEVSVLAHMVARDIRTTTGNNLSLIRELTATDPWSTTSRFLVRGKPRYLSRMHGELVTWPSCWNREESYTTTWETLQNFLTRLTHFA